MSDAICSENTSTHESLYTETTLIINASKCLICNKLLGYQGKYGLNSRYHYACLEEKQCIFCGCAGLNTPCSENSCQNVFHLFCNQRNTKKISMNDLKCPVHTECKKEKAASSYLTFKKIANNIQSNEQKLNDYKAHYEEIKAAYFSHGQIFWAIIGAQYFSSSLKLKQLPIFYKTPFKPNGKNKNKFWVSTTIKSLLKDYKMWKVRNFKNFKEFFPGNDGKKSEQFRPNKKELLPSDCRSVHLRPHSKEFIEFLEKNLRPATLDLEDDACEICLDNDYDDDDIFFKCKICLVKVHMQCYGISIEEKDWTCQSCVSSYEYKSVCALCPVTGGVLKPTVSVKSTNFNYLPHPSDSPLWVHVFCATHIDPECIKNKVKIENINLLSIDRKKFSETCQLCNSTSGAFIKCLHSHCKSFFHPECGKKLFLFTRDRSGFDIVGLYCGQHKSSKLRKTLEKKESNLQSDFLEFIKRYEKIEKTCIKRPANTDFSYEEKFKIFKYVDNYLSRKRGKFELVFKCNRLDKSLRGVFEDSTDVCTLLEPKNIGEEDCVSGKHEAADVQDFYSKDIFEVMKQELKILKLPVIPFKKEDLDPGFS